MPGVDRFSFVGLARAAGWPRVYEFDDAARFEQEVDEVLAGDGPTFVVMHAVGTKRLGEGRDVSNLEEWLRARRALLATPYGA